jgi:xanthine dehydrogenase YagS FAD-binding subunit
LLAEALLAGQPPGVAVFEGAAAALVEGARALEHNGFKIELARRTVVRALLQAAGMEAGA